MPDAKPLFVTWYRNFSAFEFYVIVAFIGFYLLFLVRLIRIGRKFKTHWLRTFLKATLRFVYFSLFLIALLGPTYGGARKEIKSIGKDIMICIDLSKSMDAVDIVPTRLEKIKFELKKLVRAFDSDRVGIVIFGSEAFMQCPLTYDQGALNLFIETLNTNLVPSGGTDFGPALKLALAKLKDDTEGPQGRNKSKIVLLISDGEDFGENTDAASSAISSEGIRLFTLGIGTEKGGNMMAGNGFRRDRDGKVIVTKLNPVSLQALARKTEGKYFEINESRNDLARLISAINSIEGELRDTRSVDVSANRYFYVLLTALIILVLDILIPVKIIAI